MVVVVKVLLLCQVLGTVAIVANHGKMSAAGGLTKTNVKEQGLNVTMTIDAHIVLDGTMVISTAGRGWENKRSTQFLATVIQTV